jgi:type I restriction enzyme R subunit
MDMLLPDPRALEYAGDLAWLGKIRSAARARYRTEQVDISDCGEKVRKLIDEAIVADGIEILVKQVNLFSPEFEQRLEASKSTEARASEMEHAIRDEIHVHLEEDPAFYRSLRERLEQIVADYKARRIDAAKQLELIGILRNELRDRRVVAEDFGLTDTGLAIYGLLTTKSVKDGAGEARVPYGQLDEAKKALAEILEESTREHIRIVEWIRKDDVQREMRRSIKRHLQAAGYGGQEREALAGRVLDLLKAREGR